MPQRSINSVHQPQQEAAMKKVKKDDKKKGTLRPWLVDVMVDNLR
jgi:hypothetical protein